MARRPLRTARRQLLDAAPRLVLRDSVAGVASPGSRAQIGDLSARRRRLFWVVHPIEQWIEAFERSADGFWILVGYFEGPDPVRIKPFDAIELPIANLWGR